ncbi:helix-turn-helix domain-containing protein [Vulcanisaeta thermophila]|uniref:helix-turn-helix domain-containing protein n=1 Tax=Vulcanisaeta thermophila TaxID=867917 RepID=UPI000853379B|nr:helix-turn-helix domain-containing protein [Vulcanisaeta thermophila]
MISGEVISHILAPVASRRGKALVVGDSSLSYDMIIRIPDKDGDRKFIIKVKEDVHKVDKDTVLDLAILAGISESTPLIVGLRYNNEEMLDGVAYKVHGIYAVNMRTMKRVLNNDSVKYVKDKGMIKARVKGSLLKELRERNNMSLGDLASILGVSRRTVYEYERDSFEASERTARILEDLFGEEVLSDVDLRASTSEIMSKITSREVGVNDRIKVLLRSFKIYSLLRAHTKLAAQSTKRAYLVESRENINGEVIKVASVLDVGLAVISGEDDVEFIDEVNQ